MECLTSLELLSVSRCEIAKLQGLEHLIYLEWLYVFDCENLLFWSVLFSMLLLFVEVLNS